MARTGRPRKEIDQTQFEKLCALQCTKLEICAFLEVNDETLDRWIKRTYKTTFSEIYKIKRCAGKISLRRNQFKLAERSASMAIFLGKQMLGQSEGTVEEEPEEETNSLLEAINAKADKLEWEE